MRAFLKSWLGVFLWTALMFFLSTDYGSGGRTLGILTALAHWVHLQLGASEIDHLNFFLRKGLHVTEYGFLAIFFWRALSVSGGWPAWGWNWRTLGEAFLVTLAFAVSDEFHQFFVPSRGSSVVDVVIDVSGAGAGLAVAGAVAACVGRFRTGLRAQA